MTFLVSDWIYELATGGYRWEPDIGRYRDMSTGRLIAERTIQNDLERFNGTVTVDALESITDRMINGNITLEQWQRQAAGAISDAWGVNIRIGVGGADQMTQADYGRLGGRLRYEYQQLNKFAIEIKAGLLSEAQIKARIGLYARAAEVGYWDGRTAAMKKGGYRWEARFLQPGESCTDCIGYAAQGKVPIGTLPEPGTDAQCQRNCNCIKEYYKEL